MTDHTVSPAVTESEMNTFRDIFTRFADTVTNASQLSQDVANLRTQVEQITRDLQQAANTNAYLSDKLSQVQREKDEALAQKATLEAENVSLRVTVDEANRTREEVAQRSGQYQREIESLRKERDEAHYRTLELEDKLKESDGRWGKLRELFGDGQDKPKPVDPQPTQTEPVKPEPYAGQDSWR